MAGRVRLWRWRRNALRRGSDRVERSARLAAVLVLLIGAPAAGVVSGTAAESRLTAVVGQDAAVNHRVSAVLTQDAPCVWVEGSAGCTASARWQAPDGSVRSGVITVPHGTSRGAQVAIWVDGTGRPTAAPPNSAQIWADALSTGAAAWAGTAMVGWAGYRATLLVLDRRRYRQWEREWAEIGPGWSHRTG